MTRVIHFIEGEENQQDNLKGSKNHDCMAGWGGNDTLTGKRGDDILVGWMGSNDTLIGGAGKDEFRLYVSKDRKFYPKGEKGPISYKGVHVNKNADDAIVIDAVYKNVFRLPDYLSKDDRITYLKPEDAPSTGFFSPNGFPVMPSIPPTNPDDSVIDINSSPSILTPSSITPPSLM